MNRRVYTGLLRIASPLLWLWMAHRAKRAGGQWGIFSAERFGRSHSPPPASFTAPVWVHAVSLGEVRAAEPLLQALLDRNLPVLLTHLTATGRAEGARLFSAAITRGQLRQAWLPYDFPGATHRFLQQWQPRCGLLIERELWPNLLAAAQDRRLPMALVSARFSASSLRQALRMGRLLRNALGSLRVVLAQTAQDADRLAQAGAHHPHVTGNLKFDLTLSAPQVAAGTQWRTAVARPVIAIASTREGEETDFIDALKQYTNDPAAPLFLWIPRHPQRFDAVAALLHKADLPFIRHSLHHSPTPETLVLLGDSVGEMAFFYAASDVAIVAGSFAPLGGQNLIEASAAHIPVIVGPHTFNFQQAAQDAIAAGAVLRAPDTNAAVRLALQLLNDAPQRNAMRTAAQTWLHAHAGATQRTLSALTAML